MRKPGENEEQIDAEIAADQSTVVVEEHREHRDTAQAVQRRYPPMCTLGGGSAAGVAVTPAVCTPTVSTITREKRAAGWGRLRRVDWT